MLTLANTIEPKTKAFLDKINSNSGPQLIELPVEEARAVFTSLQQGDVKRLPADVEVRELPVGPKGSVQVRIVRPVGVTSLLPAVIYIHGAGWVFGGWESHDRLVLELVNQAQVAAVFVDYSLSPEARYPTAIEECYDVTNYVVENARALSLDVSKLVVAGDSVGGNMTIATTLLAKERGGPHIDFQVLFYPVTNSNFDNESYQKFAKNHFLTREAMIWFWNQYAPDESDRKKITASPLQASLDQLKGLPPALVFTAEHDVLRDEGEAYAHKLSLAGVNVTAVRCLGTIHDFVMLNAITDTPAPRLAISTAVESLKSRR